MLSLTKKLGKRGRFAKVSHADGRNLQWKPPKETRTALFFAIISDLTTFYF
jgi:hypothetical protein